MCRSDAAGFDSQPVTKENGEPPTPESLGSKSQVKAKKTGE